MSNSPRAEVRAPIAGRAAGAVVPVLALGYFAQVTASNMFAPALSPLAAAFGVSTGTAGQIGAVAPLTWALLAPLVGRWSDRVGRRPVAAAGLLVMGGGALAAAAARSLLWLATARLITGIGGAGFGPTGYALIADLFPPAARAPALGGVLAGFSAASLLGLPAVAVITGWLSWRWAFAFVGALLVAAAGAVWLACPDTRRAPSDGAEPPAAPATPLSDLRLLMRQRAAAAMLVANTLHQAAAAVASTYTAAFLVEHFQVNVRTLALWLAVIACGAVSGSLLGGRTARTRPLQVAIASCAATALLAPLFFSGALPLLAATAIATLNALAQSLRAPAHLSMVSEAAPEDRGALLGLNATSNQTGYTVGAVIGGGILGAGGYAGIGVAAALSSAAACAVYAGVRVAGRRRRPRRA